MIRKRSLDGKSIVLVATVPSFIYAQLKRQIVAFVEAGAVVTLITSPGPELKFLSKLAGVQCIQLKISRSITIWQDIQTLAKLIAHFNRSHIDLVHSATPKAGLLVSVASFVTGIPVRLHTFTGQPWVNMRGSVRLMSRFADWIIGKLNTRCYADSHSQRDFLISEKLIAKDKIDVLGNGSIAGVDLERFTIDRWSDAERNNLKNELGLSKNRTVILFVGRLTQDKGIGELLQAFERVLERGYEADLLLVGPLDHERGGLDILDVAKINNRPNVRWVGYSDVPEKYMAISDFLCLPSYREGFGTTVIEAAAMGLPTLGTNICGLVDAVEDEITGILVSSRDVQSLADGMFKLLDNPVKTKNMGVLAQARCKTFFDANVVNAFVINEYVKFLSLAR